MCIIFSGRTYDEALVIINCERFDITRKKIFIKSLRKIITQGPLKEHRENVHYYIIRNSQDISLYKCRTEYFKSIFLPSTIAEMSK